MTKQELLTNHTVGDIINNPILTEFIGGEMEFMDEHGEQ